MIELLSAPLRLSLDVTSACDLNCQHCRHGAAVGLGASLEFDDVRRVINESARMGVFRLTLSGGEPMVRHDIIEILLHALRSKVGRVFLSTNGLHLEKHDLRPLLPYRGRLAFKISLDGPPPVHDRVRGRVGAGVAARQAIVTMIARGFEVQVTTTLMRDNLSHIGELLAWTAQARCSRHNLVEVVPVGRAVPEMVLLPEERRRACQAIREAAARCSRPGYAVMAKLPFAEDESVGLRCTGGTEECGILADGSVVGCRLMPDLIEGNIKRSSLTEIWSAPNAFSLFRRIGRDGLAVGCRACERNASCLGGCHAFARAVTGDFFAADTRCPRSTAPASEVMESPC